MTILVIAYCQKTNWRSHYSTNSRAVSIPKRVSEALNPARRELRQD
ncbi:hypothetical protein [Pseudanabaena sp. CCNP1317]|nr:hypothetical protein [Pseudanabaena sp. CCNP1317]